MSENHIYWGWSSICPALDLSKRSKRTAKRILKELKVKIYYDCGTPFIKKSDLENALSKYSGSSSFDKHPLAPLSTP